MDDLNDRVNESISELKRVFMLLDKETLAENLAENCKRLVGAGVVTAKAIALAQEINRLHRRGDLDGVGDSLDELDDITDILTTSVDIRGFLAQCGITGEEQGPDIEDHQQNLHE